MDTAECHCKRHKQNCGCLTDAFLTQAKVNHFCCLVQAKSPEQYAQELHDLATYHARDIHSWEGGSCKFHSPRKCSCGNCEKGSDIKCEGTLYKTKNALTCPFHRLCYAIVLYDIAKDAKSIIHPDLLRGNSNLCESKFSVVAKFRAKDKALQQTTYECYTDIGLLQSNLTWARNAWDPHYHWIVELLEKFGLQPTATMNNWIGMVADLREKSCTRKKSKSCKDARNVRKRARMEEQEQRKKWVKRQRVQMTYGSNDKDVTAVCTSCGKEGHSRKTSSLCDNYVKK